MVVKMRSWHSINACFQKAIKAFSYVFNVLQNLLMKSCHISAELRPESKPSEVAFSVALVGNFLSPLEYNSCSVLCHGKPLFKCLNK